MAGRYLKKKVSLLLISVLTVLTLFPNVNGSLSTNFNVYTNSLGIQIGYALTGDDDWLLLEAQNNFINSSTTALSLTKTGSGYFRFLSNESFNLELSFSEMSISLSGDQGNEKRVVENSSVHSVTALDVVTVFWSQRISPYVPLTFLFWIIGLFACFLGPYMGIKKLKKGEHREGLIFIVTVCSVGFALVLAGMFSA